MGISLISYPILDITSFAITLSRRGKMNNLRFCLLTLFLAASVKAASDDDCGCTAKTKTYGVGEYKFIKPLQRQACSNLEEVADVVERCEGADGSFSQINLVNNKYFNIAKLCADNKKLGCGFKVEMRKMKVSCTKQDGTSEETEMQRPVNVGCRCAACKGPGERCIGRWCFGPPWGR